jgi:cubilin
VTEKIIQFNVDYIHGLLTMSKILIKCLFLVVWFVHLDCQNYDERPKITTLNGHLILEAAKDKSIHLRINGPKSGIFVQDINLLHLSISNSDEQQQPGDSFEKYLIGPNGFLKRLERLESQRTSPTASVIQNITLLMRRVNRLSNRISILQTQISSRLRDECQSAPCQNGGTCLNLQDGHHCLCPSNWEGLNCDIDVNECRNFAGTDLGCQNGATCINRPGTYECLCLSGWFGLHCTRRAKDCSAGNFEMCGHGTCVPVTSGEGIKCICNQGWQTNGTGATCLTDVDECDSSQGHRCSINPKVNCINLPGTFRCGQCPPGYEGDGFTCHDIDECITTANGGCSLLVTCHNTIGSRICGPCPPGYQGDGVACTWQGSCNLNHGGCHPSAQCIESMGLVQCMCPFGLSGDGLGLHGCYISTGGNSTQRCESNPCGAHGRCHPLITGYTCICHEGYTGIHCEASVDYCSSQPCQNGGTCRVDDSSTGFRCECTVQYSGNLCQMRARSCSGVLDAEEGSLIYPLNNSSYDHNSKCAWVIHTDTGKVINVTFSKFDLELEPECMYDFLQIHDGRTSSSQLIGRFCGTELPKGGNIVSSHNNLYLWFRSDRTVARDGFALHWNSIDPVCGGEIDANKHGHISSPGSPGKYPPNRDCYWHLTTTLGKRIQISFFALDIETHSNCSFDYLVIYDGEHTIDPVISQYCNSTQPPPVQSAGSDILIHFHSDAYGSGNGFQITYASIAGIPGCGGYYTVDKGEIMSPSFNGSYLSNLLCEYKISSSPDTKIRLDFKSFKLETSLRCRYDYLKVYDGPSSNSKLVGKFCGTTYPKSYTSSSNSLFIIFKTDQSSASEGFTITFESLCQKSIFGDSGVITSPGYPFRYPENKVCEYIIATTPRKAIQLTFQDFDIEDNRYYQCQYDNVEIRDGPDGNSTLIGRFCGGLEQIPPVQTSTHNYLYLKFNSDISLTGAGFYANFTTIDTECGGVYKDATGMITHPSGDKSDLPYNNDQKCTWLLVAPAGMYIKLNWIRFDIEKMPDCMSDYVELIEIDNNNQNETLGKFCGTASPPALTTSTNRLMINFESDASVRFGGFSMSYLFLDEKTQCGAVFLKSHGFIYSPGWPNRYETNRDCTWTITVPAGQQIMLNITQFDLERHIRDSCDLGDHLEIRNGGSENSPLIGKYCGNFEYKRIISTSNKLYLHFHSDFYLTGKGFKIEWDGTITGCGGTLTSPSGSISSPNYPDSYNENAECFYKIVTSHGSKIQIRFTDLDLERTSSCTDDYVEIFDGRDENSVSLGKHCFLNPNLDQTHIL